jgi:hypothetical protein
MNKKSIAIMITLFLIMSSVQLITIYAQPSDNHMLPGMLSKDAPYYRFILSEDESDQNRDYSPPDITGSIGYWIEGIDETMVLNYIQDLVDFGARVTESSAFDQAGTYIHDQFESMGLEVEYHNWTSGSRSGKNVVATLDGLDPN